MKPTHPVEKLLSETSLPHVRAGLHQEKLKQALLVEMNAKEKAMAGSSAVLSPSKAWWRNSWPEAAAAGIAFALLSAGAVFLFKEQSRPPVVTTAVAPPASNSNSSSNTRSEANVILQSRRLTETLQETQVPRESEGLRRKSLEQSVAEAQVILVGTAIDFAPAPPHVKGDLPENTIRFKVNRVLKGKMDQEFVTTRTPTSGTEFLGRDWIVMLSPENIAGKHDYAGCYTIRLEDQIKAIIVRETK